MSKVGRPIKYTKKRLEEINQLILDYTEKTDIPIVAEFAYLNNIPREELYRHHELNHSIKALTAKKETVLEKGALKNALNPTMAIFSLKQLGWKDKREIEQTNTNIELTKEERKARIKELKAKLAKR